jgi:hypothetical protein
MGDTFHEAPGPPPPGVITEAVRLPAPASHEPPSKALAIAHGDVQQGLRAADAPKWVLVLVDDIMHRHRADAEERELQEG